MAESFDSYHKWLGIPPAEQPPNHYRLLGIAAFETDPDVIEQAADRQMAHVQTHKTGAHSASSQRLLNELSAAKLCLLSQADKTEYDAALRARLAPPAAAPNAPPPIPVSPPPAVHNPSPTAPASAAPAPFVATAPSRLVNRSKSHGPQTAALAAIVAAVLVGGAAFYLFVLAPAAKQEVQVAAKPENDATSTRATTPAVAAPKPAVADSKPAIAVLQPAVEIEKRVDADPQPEAGDPASPAEPAAPAPAMPDLAARAGDETTRNAAAPGMIDLLGQIEPARDAVSGEWRMEDGALLTPADAGARLRIPFEPAAEYEIKLEAVRLEGKGTLGLGLLVGGSPVLAAVDAFEGTITGLDMIDGRACNDNETTHHGSALLDEAPNKLEYRVRPNHIQVAVNGETLINWQGDSQRLATSFPIPDPPGLSLVVWGAKYRITRLEATKFEAPRPQLAGPVDLLPLIDPQRDAVSGQWRREEANLVSPNGGGWLMVPHEVPPAYLLEAEVQRLSGADSLGFALVIDGRLTEAVLDGWWGGISGLHLLDGLEANNEANETRRVASVIRKDAKNSIQYLVDKYGVTVRCNGMEVFDFSGDARRLSFGGGIANTRNDRLYLGVAGAAAYQFSKLRLTPLNVADRRLYDLRSATARLGIPDEKTLRDAEKQVRQSFRDRRTAAKDPAGKVALARLMIEEAAGETSPEIRYAMFQEAISLAAAAGDYSEATGAILAVSRQFDVSPLVLKRQALAQANGAVKSLHRKTLLADDALRLFDEAVMADDYETAEEAGRLASIIARASKDRLRSEQVRMRVKEAAELRREFDKLAASRERLQQAPDDAEAHLALGQFDCVWKRDWPQGMAHFNLGADPALRELARDELLKSQQPAEKIALAERWLALAETVMGEPRVSYQVRGIEWFQKAAGVKTAERGDLKNKVDALARETSIADRPRRWLELARSAFVQEAEIDGGQGVEWFNLPGDFDVGRSWSLTFEFGGAEPNSRAVLFMIGDGRAGCDPIVVILDGDKLVARVNDSRDSLKMFSIDCRLDAARLAQWRRLRLSYRESDRTLALFVDGEEAAAGAAPFSPYIDRRMPIWVCGDNARSQRFVGKVRMVALTND